jgi:hypothetical protein
MSSISKKLLAMKEIIKILINIWLWLCKPSKRHCSEECHP